MTTSSNTYSIHPYVDTASKYVNGELDPAAYNEMLAKNGWEHKVITPDMIPEDIKQIYAKQGEESLNPWYQNELAVGKAGIAADTGSTARDYQQTVEDLNRGLQEDTASLADKEGTQGTWGSSARAERQGSLNAKYGSSLNTAYGKAADQMTKTLRQGEYNYGTETPGLTSTSLAQYGVGGGQVSQNPMAQYQYNPFGGQGTLNVQKKALGAQLGGDYLKARIKSPTIQ